MIYSQKLLQINVSANSGSTGKIAEDIGKVVLSQGWKSYIAYGRTGNKSASELIKIGDSYGWNVKEHGFETRLFDNHGLSSRLATKKFIKQLDAINPDIIHLHNIHGYYINYKILFEYLIKKDIPVVWTLHDCWAFTGHCGHFDFVGCFKWKTGCCACPCRQDYPKSQFLDCSRKNFLLKKQLFTSVKNMTIVPVSHWLGGLVKESFLKNYPMEVIHNGIDLNIFKPYNDTQAVRDKYNLNGKFVLLGVANIWSKRKGLADYLELSKIIDKDTVIVLVGLNDRQLKDLPQNIIGIKRTENQQQLVELYSLADVVLNLSYEETFGLTTVEGFACGTSSIVYDKTASPELIKDSSGHVVQAGNIKQIKEAVEKIRTNSKEEYQKTCRQRAENFYNKDVVFKKYSDIYNKVLKERN
ncbi:MAG: glycosyltransferase [Bacteroidales bacterium]|nr:glycosyltransferase [Bacteroidales bacterium]